MCTNWRLVVHLCKWSVDVQKVVKCTENIQSTEGQVYSIQKLLKLR